MAEGEMPEGGGAAVGGPPTTEGEGDGQSAEALVTELLDLSGARGNRDLLRELLVTALGLADGTPSRLDLKIATAALSEMGRAFHLFAPFRQVRKLTMFGSARTHQSDPLYAQAKDL